MQAIWSPMFEASSRRKEGATLSKGCNRRATQKSSKDGNSLKGLAAFGLQLLRSSLTYFIQVCSLFAHRFAPKSAQPNLLPLLLQHSIILIGLLASPLHAKELPETIIRVAILQNVSSFNLGSENDYVVVDLTTGEKNVLSHKNILLVEPNSKGILIGNIQLNRLVRVMPKNDGEFLRVNGKRYRDTILIRKNETQQMTVINELGLDDYLYGILPREVCSNWHIESLKAQAVVSRTFALKNLNRHDSEQFNLCNQVHCQVYGGLDDEKNETNLAVDKTHNEVLTYEEQLANTVFFANCGGRTEEPLNAWETDFSPPYLKSIRCKYCKKEPHYNWKQKLTQEEIARVLRKKNFSVTLPIKSVHIASYGKSNRAKFLKIKHAKGEIKIRASHFRLAAGPETIRSTLFTKIKKVKDGFYFQGHGWGHGVGMCQEGAKGLAETGANYKKIIRFYYPGTHLEKCED